MLAGCLHAVRIEPERTEQTLAGTTRLASYLHPVAWALRDKQRKRRAITITMTRTFTRDRMQCVRRLGV